MDNICFKKKEGIEIDFVQHDVAIINTHIQLIVSQAIILGFVLVDSLQNDEAQENEIRLFVPLNTAPSFIRTIEEKETRLTENLGDFQHVHPFSTNNVLCLCFVEPIGAQESAHSILRELKLLEREYLAAAMFQTRVEMLDQTEVVKAFQTSKAWLLSEQAFLATDTYSPETSIKNPPRLPSKYFTDRHHDFLPVFCGDSVGDIRDLK